MFKRSILTLIVIVAFMFPIASAQEALDDCQLKAVQGTYEGVITYAGSERKDPVVNEFTVTADCQLFGRYEFTEPGRKHPLKGIFVPVAQLDTNTLILAWYDPYGNGKLRIAISPNFETFTGTWGSSDQAFSQGTWSGRRIIDTPLFFKGE